MLKKTFITKLVNKKTKRFFRLRWILLLLVIIIGGGLFYQYILSDLPSPSQLGSTSYPQSTQIFDRNGKLLYTIYANKNQSFVPLSKIPLFMQEATISIEDRYFYTHGAIDLTGIARALLADLSHQSLQGGSTLTQQLVKNSLLTQDRTIQRKIKEVILAFLTEAIYPKTKILEMYLNQIPYGGTAYGVEAASQTYFGKNVQNLDLAQASFLAGLPQAPSEYSPYGSDPTLGKQRQIEVLNAMYNQKYITKQQLTQAENEQLKFKKISDNILAPHFVFYVKNLLEQKYGVKTVEQGGLKVITSLDLDLQNYAQASVAAEINRIMIPDHVTNGAALITDPNTGEILAMVGSIGYNTPGYGNVNMTTALLQPGSSIKPITYGLGLTKGYTAATPFIDDKTCFPGNPPYCPHNYDNKWHGAVQMRYALGNSFNIPAVKMLELDTIPDFLATASAMGITTFNDPSIYGLSLTLGSAEVKMTDMATVYGIFANGGYRINLHPILKVTDSSGKVLEQYNPPSSPIFGQKVISAGVAYIMTSMLMDNTARYVDFGSDSSLVIPGQAVAAKTGTTNDFRDNWTIGYTIAPAYVVAVWVGNDDRSPMSSIASGITGAAPIWHILMTHLLQGKKSEPPVMPDDVIGKIICNPSGLLVPAHPDPTCNSRYEYFIKGTAPTQTDPGPQNVWVDKTTQDLPAPGQTTNLELKPHVVITDPTGDRYCLDCPHPSPTPTPTPAH